MLYVRVFACQGWNYIKWKQEKKIKSLRTEIKNHQNLERTWNPGEVANMDVKRVETAIIIATTSKNFLIAMLLFLQEKGGNKNLYKAYPGLRGGGRLEISNLCKAELELI